ncbi:MAG: hypothetical protein MZV64_18705 [Ignavibacteriales bacterium]|nr:hypothetical protein [Ignavibacteriales bacterium]
MKDYNSNYECEVIFITNKFAEEHKDAIAELANVKKNNCLLEAKRISENF